MLKKISVFVLFFVLIFSVMAVSAPRRPVELIPQRIILEGRERSTVLRILNRNSEAMKYRLETIILRQNVLGSKEQVTDPTPEEQKIIKMIRFSPRQFRIPPNSIQTVRLMARKPPNLGAGEYRSHLKVVPRPDSADKKSEQTGGISIDLNIIISVSIPVIIRHGETNVDLAAKDAMTETGSDGIKSLKVRIIADGNRSVFMDASLYHGDKLLGQKKGFAIYQPNGERDVLFPLKADLPPSGSSLKLILHDREKDEKPLITEIPILLKY